MGGVEGIIKYGIVSSGTVGRGQEIHWFAGIRLFFRLGEEVMRGGLAMMEVGLDGRFSVDMVFGMYNIHGLERGKSYFKSAWMMSAADSMV